MKDGTEIEAEYVIDGLSHYWKWGFDMLESTEAEKKKLQKYFSEGYEGYQGEGYDNGVTLDGDRVTITIGGSRTTMPVEVGIDLVFRKMIFKYVFLIEANGKGYYYASRAKDNTFQKPTEFTCKSL